MKLPPGLYEQLLTEGLMLSLKGADPRTIHKGSLREAETPNRIALHLGKQIESALASIPEKDRVSVGIQVARELLVKLREITGADDLKDELLAPPGEVLHSIMKLLPDSTPRFIDPPLIPLLDTTLLTNAPGEPRVGHQLLTEIQSAQRVDILMAFIRMTGIAPMREVLRQHINNGGLVRVLTTSYTGSTQYEALDALSDLGADVRISYDTSSTRLHAKAWLFYRESGFSTAYIGSSNLTHSAQMTGLEWNVRVSGARNPDVIDKVSAVFESYWANNDFRIYNKDEFQRHTESVEQRLIALELSPLAVEPRPFQERLLEEISVSRLQGWHRNLLVSATGTGKTVMAALDYARLRSILPRSRLLFIAHRQEILDQSQRTFQHALRDPLFGEQWIGGRRPKHFEHVFASVQSLNAADLENLAPDHFDVVIVDEFHHAAAPSYEAFLRYLQPSELLGLTATPERSDGLSILSWFDGRIAAELRLWDAIDQNYLAPFLYYGVHDGLDLRDVPWRRGVGYAIDELTNRFTSTRAWGELVVKQFVEKTCGFHRVRALGFCVSVRHAEYMASVFKSAGIPAIAISAQTSAAVRIESLLALDRGDVRIVFSVDLFNEGVDVPSVDALLMLRPTESGTLFLQQLGRGLRKMEGKTACIVLDFVGRHRKEFRFDRRFRSLFGGTRKDVRQQIENGFPFLPSGCHMELDWVSREIVLASFRSAIPVLWNQKVNELRIFAASGHPVSLETFLEHSGLDLDDVYSGGRTWMQMCADAGLMAPDEGIVEAVLRRAISRLLHIDDLERIQTYEEILSAARPPKASSFSERRKRLMRMLLGQLMDRVSRDLLPDNCDIDTALSLLWRHPRILLDIRELLAVLKKRISHLHESLCGGGDVPIRVHASYSRAEILAALGVGQGWRPVAWWEGVRWCPGANADVFVMTFDKTSGGFSPTTRYRDYAISRELIHWESQSTTRSATETGQRYQHHKARGSEVILFARLRDDIRCFWCLGSAEYVRHEGDRPMAIVWRLKTPLSGDLFAQFAAAVA